MRESSAPEAPDGAPLNEAANDGGFAVIGREFSDGPAFGSALEFGARALALKSNKEAKGSCDLPPTGGGVETASGGGREEVVLVGFGGPARDGVGAEPKSAHESVKGFEGADVFGAAVVGLAPPKSKSKIPAPEEEEAGALLVTGSAVWNPPNSSSSSAPPKFVALPPVDMFPKEVGKSSSKSTRFDAAEGVGGVGLLADREGELELAPPRGSAGSGGEGERSPSLCVVLESMVAANELRRLITRSDPSNCFYPPSRTPIVVRIVPSIVHLAVVPPRSRPTGTRVSSGRRKRSCAASTRRTTSRSRIAIAPKTLVSARARAPESRNSHSHFVCRDSGIFGSILTGLFPFGFDAVRVGEEVREFFGAVSNYPRRKGPARAMSLTKIKTTSDTRLKKLTVETLVFSSLADVMKVFQGLDFVNVVASEINDAFRAVFDEIFQESKRFVDATPFFTRFLEPID